MSGSSDLVVLLEESKNRVLGLTEDEGTTSSVYSAMEEVYNYAAALPILMVAVVITLLPVILAIIPEFLIDQVVFWISGVNLNDSSIDVSVRLRIGEFTAIIFSVATTIATFVVAKLHYNRRKKIAMETCWSFLDSVAGRKALRLIAEEDRMYPGEMAKSILGDF